MLSKVKMKMKAEIMRLISFLGLICAALLLFSTC